MRVAVNALWCVNWSMPCCTEVINRHYTLDESLCAGRSKLNCSSVKTELCVLLGRSAKCWDVCRSVEC